MNIYLEMRDRHQEEINAFPMKFAFSDKQFEEGMIELGLKPTDTDKIYRFGYSGGFYRKEDSPRLLEIIERHTKELEDAVEDEETGEEYCYQMFLYELANHEYGYTRDLDDTFNALGLEKEEFDRSENMKKGLARALERFK